MPARSGSEQFAGTARFAIRRRLGAGGSGVVYEAFDRDRGAMVALKTLRSADPEDLYRFKQEFRALADITHPNLITLYELLSEGNQWFFTMEMIEGKSFLDHVRGQHDPDLMDSWVDAATPSVPMEEPGPEEGADGTGQAIPVALTADSLSRLRAALRQLAEGLSALHQAGKLHRDIKPSNVLVSKAGRVVLLDFGLVGELGARGVNASGARRVMGTPSYMSPEQALGAPLTEASDWCSVGIMLYVALTGTRPFPRGGIDDLGEPRLFEPPPPRALVADLPEDLDRLCQALLRHDPKARASAREVLSVVGSNGDRARSRAHEWTSPWREAPFVGRGRELAELERAFRAAKERRPVTLYVGGASGIGKSALVHHFLADLQRRDTVALLEGRCYERESVPYKALDSLVDGLSRHLKRLPVAEVEALLPRDVPALARLFPVLRRVEAVARARRRYPEVPDLLEMRRRAFGALRELLARLADREPVVLFIDDVHWGDLDSAALLADLMRGPDPPALLLIATYHSEDAARSPLLRGLLEAAGPEGGAEVRRLRVEAFSFAEACELAQELVGRAASPAQAETLARESGGNPFLLRELARHAVDVAPGSGPGRERVTLESVLNARLSMLPSEARRLLEAVAVAGQPLSFEAATRAARLESGELEALRLLGATHLVRTRGAHEQSQIEAYHHRIREAVLARLPAAELTALHHRLALSLETTGEGGPETLAVHFAAAGESERAAELAATAARQAFEALAFDRAARLFRWTLDLSPRAGPEARSVRIKLGEALANAARGVEAAEAYLAAAEGAPAAEQLDLRRRAAEQLLISGHFDQGLEVLRAVLQTIGMKLADTPARALLSLLQRRARIRLRGLHFRERDATQVAAEELIRIDTCWTVAVGLSFVDTIRGADFQARHLLLALEAGEPYRVARALAIEVGYQATAGGRNRVRTERVTREATALAERIGHPHALALVTLAGAATAFFAGDWPTARRLGERAEHLLRERCTGVAWELDNAQLLTLLSLLSLGELREVTGRLAALIKEAEDRGDLYVATSMRTRVAYVAELAADRPEKGREEVREGMRLWSREGFHVQHLWELFAHVEISLYAGDGLEAWRRMSAGWPLLVEGFLARLGVVPEADLSGALGLLVKELTAQGACFVEWTRPAEPVVLASAGQIESPLQHAGLQEFVQAAVRPGSAGEITTAILTGEPVLSCAVLSGPGAERLGLFVWGEYRGRAESEPLLRALVGLLDRFRPRPVHLPRGTAGRSAHRLAFPDGYVAGESPAMASLYGQMLPLLQGDLPVLIVGETGVGKEFLARILHTSSSRKHGPFVAINCAAIPSELLEAEMFGIGKGVATGVVERQGKFQLAERGTLFLDEIGDMPLELQAKLLRALQEKEIHPVGSRPVPVDIRVVTATNSDLQQRMEEGRFRRDLYYRVAGYVLQVPPVRRRKEDIPVLVEEFVRHFAQETAKSIRGVTVRALRALIEYDWPGNVRQLEHEVRRLVYLCPDGGAIDSLMLSAQILSPAPGAAPAEGAEPADGSLSIEEQTARLQTRLIREALARAGGNRTQAAKLLGISRNGLAIKMERLGITG